MANLTRTAAQIATVMHDSAYLADRSADFDPPEVGVVAAAIHNNLERIVRALAHHAHMLTGEVVKLEAAGANTGDIRGEVEALHRVLDAARLELDAEKAAAAVRLAEKAVAA